MPLGDLCRFIRSSGRGEVSEDRYAGGAPNNARLSVSADSRGGSKGFYQTKWDRVSNISENPNAADGSEWRAGEWVQGHW